MSSTYLTPAHDLQPPSEVMTSTQAPSETARTERIGFYIDGYNVYYGLRQKGFRRYYWLDYRALANAFVHPHQILARVKYFTSRISGPDDSRKRQSTYLDALAARGGLTIIEGRIERRPVKCPACDHRWRRPEEKKTDVAIATNLVADAHRDLIDTAMLLCADADLVPAVQEVRSIGKRVIVISPRGRTSDELTAEADHHLHINKSRLGRCQLPDEIESNGVTLRRPPEWS